MELDDAADGEEEEGGLRLALAELDSVGGLSGFATTRQSYAHKELGWGGVGMMNYACDWSSADGEIEREKGGGSDRGGLSRRGRRFRARQQLLRHATLAVACPHAKKRQNRGCCQWRQAGNLVPAMKPYSIRQTEPSLFPSLVLLILHKNFENCFSKTFHLIKDLQLCFNCQHPKIKEF